MNNKLKEKKKKAREKAAHLKVVKRREELRLERKEENRKLMMERSLEPVTKPIVGSLKQVKEQEEIRKKEIKDQIEKNFKILEALEAEYDQEQAARKAVHKNLEEEGHKNIKDKMDALHQKALESGYKEKELNN